MALLPGERIVLVDERVELVQERGRLALHIKGITNSKRLSLIFDSLVHNGNSPMHCKEDGTFRVEVYLDKEPG